jgi:hypothetical protein
MNNYLNVPTRSCKAWTITWTYQHAPVHISNQPLNCVAGSSKPRHTIRETIVSSPSSSMSVFCSFIQCRPSVRKRSENRVEGETLLNHHNSLYGEGGSRGGPSKECRVEQMPQQSHIKALSSLYLFSLFVWESARHFCSYFPFFPAPPKSPTPPPIFFFSKANFSKISFTPLR